MKMKTIVASLLILAAWPVHADMPVIDPALLIQAIAQVQLAIGQLEQITTQVHRLGDPNTYRPAGASAVIQSLDTLGIGKTVNELRGLANGQAALVYDGNGLYRVVGADITTAAGTQVARPADDYKKFDAIVQATSALEAVLNDTAVRRQKDRDDIRATTEQLRTADTVAEIHKLQGVLAAQAADLQSVDKEPDAAMHRALMQKMENDNDAARQAQARQEERIVDFQSAQQALGQFLTPNTAPVLIPDPRHN
jgi:hypothetical protein